MSASLSVGGSVREDATKAGACSNGSSVAAAATATALDAAAESTSTFPSSSPSSSSSSSDTLFPVVDLTPLLLADGGGGNGSCDGDDASLLHHHLTNNPDALAASKLIASSLVATGCVLVRDPRVSELDNSRFLDLLERYFEQPEDLKKKDARPELHYQIGATPEGVERPSLLREDSTSAARARRLVERIESTEKSKGAAAGDPSSHLPTWPRGADPKWRFFWRVGPRPASTAFPELNSPQVVPQAFEGEWEETLDGWGKKMLDALDAVARGAAIGLGMRSPDALSSLLREGPHLLAPTGSDLARHSRPGTVLAGCHADLNLLTVHGRGRLPGLFVWTRAGERVAVRVPAGCLLLQAGMQLEYLTGGAIEAGMHEVLVTPEALEKVAALREEGGGGEGGRKKGEEEGAGAGAACSSAWRVSSTVFGHVASDRVLRPLAPFDAADADGEDGGEQSSDKYPPVLAGDFVSRELEAIALKKE